MNEELYAFVWAGSYKALAEELNEMLGRKWGKNPKYFIAAVTPVIDCSILDCGVGVIARVFLGPCETVSFPLGAPWVEAEYPGRPA